MRHKQLFELIHLELIVLASPRRVNKNKVLAAVARNRLSEICGGVNDFHRQPQDLSIFLELLYGGDAVGIRRDERPLEILLQHEMRSNLRKGCRLADACRADEGNNAGTVGTQAQPVRELHDLRQIPCQNARRTRIKTVQIHIGDRDLAGKILAQLLMDILPAQCISDRDDFLWFVRRHHGGEHCFHLCQLILKETNSFRRTVVRGCIRSRRNGGLLCGRRCRIIGRGHRLLRQSIGRRFRHIGERRGSGLLHRIRLRRRHFRRIGMI